MDEDCDLSWGIKLGNLCEDILDCDLSLGQGGGTSRKGTLL